jgi:hypothetical protein
MLSWPPKGPAEVLDYDLDWTARIRSDTIVSSAWAFTSTDDSMAIEQTLQSGASTKVWLSGGTLGRSYVLKNSIATAGGRDMEQSVQILVRIK